MPLSSRSKSGGAPLLGLSTRTLVCPPPFPSERMGHPPLQRGPTTSLPPPKYSHALWHRFPADAHVGGGSVAAAECRLTLDPHPSDQGVGRYHRSDATQGGSDATRSSSTACCDRLFRRGPIPVAGIAAAQVPRRQVPWMRESRRRECRRSAQGCVTESAAFFLWYFAERAP